MKACPQVNPDDLDRESNGSKGTPGMLNIVIEYNELQADQIIPQPRKERAAHATDARHNARSVIVPKHGISVINCQRVRLSTS